MKRKQFGQIIKSLRKEQYDYASGRTWTQRHLADETNLSERIISNIEQGRRANLNDDEIQKLAGGLRLSILEE